jgi:hypothetical protein
MTRRGAASTIRDVTRARASERVSKLRTITVERGATPHYAPWGSAVAALLAERYGLDRPAPVAAYVARYAAGAGADRRSPRSLRFVAHA